MIKVSVIIPTYQPGSYIVECLDSLCNQTLINDSYEIIVVLNGTETPFRDRLTEYASKAHQTNISIVYTEIPGVSNARNMGLQVAKGEFIAFIDDDDYVTPDYLESLTSRANSDTLVVSNVKEMDDVSGIVSENYYLTEAFRRDKAAQHISFFHGRHYLSPVWGKVIHRNMIGQTVFDTDFTLGEDSLFMFSISDKINNIVLTADETTYFLRKRANSASHRKYTYSYRFAVAMKTCWRYITIYCRDMAHYNLLLFLTRIAATLRKLFTRNYE